MLLALLTALIMANAAARFAGGRLRIASQHAGSVVERASSYHALTVSCY